MGAGTVSQPPAQLDPRANSNSGVVRAVGDRGVKAIGIEQEHIAWRKRRGDRVALSLAKQRERVARGDWPDRAPE